MRSCGMLRPVLPCLLFLLTMSPLTATARLRVVTTVAPLTDMVQQVGGQAIELHGLVPEGVNSHTFRPTPGDVQYLATADLVILNGLSLEISTDRLVRASGKPGVNILKLGDRTISPAEWVFDLSFPQEQGHPNPHLWLNVAYAMHYVRLIRDQLMAQDEARHTLYEQNAERYLARLTQLDRCIAMATATIPVEHRLLLTYHDSWPYFARRYGLSVLGAVQPASFFEPSPREVARIVEQLRRTGVPAIFGSAVFPSKVLEKIAAETGVQYVTALRDDVLPGKPGTPQHSYIGMMLDNVTVMTTALGGNPQAFAACTTTLLHETD